MKDTSGKRQESQAILYQQNMTGCVGVIQFIFRAFHGKSAARRDNEAWCITTNEINYRCARNWVHIETNEKNGDSFVFIKQKTKI